MKEGESQNLPLLNDFQVDSLDLFSDPITRKCPETMEQLDQEYGFILYTTQISGPRAQTKIVLQHVKSNAEV